MKMIGHDHKFMQKEPPLLPVVLENIDQEPRHAIGLEKRAPSLGCRRDEECAN